MSLADAVITIPTAEFWSLNLGQAVLLLGYEWLKSADTTPAVRTRPSVAVPATPRGTGRPVRASGEGTGCGRVPLSPAKRETMVRNIRAMIMRSGLSDQQVRTIRGMIVALVRNKYRGQKKERRESGSHHRLCPGRVAGDRFRRRAAVARERKERPRACCWAPSPCSCWRSAAAHIFLSAGRIWPNARPKASTSTRSMAWCLI